MNGVEHWRRRWLRAHHAWQQRIEAADLQYMADALGGAFKPLAPLAAQFLWLVEPGLALLGGGDAVRALADLLLDPAQGPDHYPES